MAFGLENLGIPRAEMKARVEETLELTGIRHLAERSPYSLSGGQQQRVALASILVMRPRVLVLDEPTSQLDPIGTREVFGVIRATSKQGMTVVLVEHKNRMAFAAFADRVIALCDGEIVRARRKPGEVPDRPQPAPASGFGVSRYTQVARAAAQNGWWPSGRPLPVTLEEALAGFQAAKP